MSNEASMAAASPMAACKRILKRRGREGEAGGIVKTLLARSFPTSTRLGIGLQANNIKMDGPRVIWARRSSVLIFQNPHKPQNDKI